MSLDRPSAKPVVTDPQIAELADAGERICLAALETILSSAQDSAEFGDAAGSVKVVADSVAEMAEDLFPEVARETRDAAALPV